MNETSASFALLNPYKLVKSVPLDNKCARLNPICNASTVTYAFYSFAFLLAFQAAMNALNKSTNCAYSSVSKIGSARAVASCKLDPSSYTFDFPGTKIIHAFLLPLKSAAAYYPHTLFSTSKNHR